MSEIMIDEIPSSENDNISRDDEETWIYGNNKSKSDENVDVTTASSIDEFQDRSNIGSVILPTTVSLTGIPLDDDSDDSDDDGIKVTIGNYEPELSTFQARQKNRTMLTGGSVIPPKPSTTKGVDLDAQGMINGQPTYEYDLLNAYKDDEKPWKKPGADIADFFNYGFTEETWVSYSDRQRRLRSDNNLIRFNGPHIPPMPHMIPGHPGMLHPMNPHAMMMMNKPMNMPIMTRPMNIRRPDGKIDVIGATDQTSRRPMFETANNFEHPSFINGAPFPGNQSSNDDLASSSSSSSPVPNNPSASGGTHTIPILGGHRLPMMPVPHGMPFRPPFGHPHGPGGPHFFPRGPAGGMHGDRPLQPYFVHHRPRQPWDKNGAPVMHGFPPGTFQPQMNASVNNGGNGQMPTSRNSTPENRASRSPTPEENRTNGASTTIIADSGGDNNEKSSKDDRFKDRYRDDRDHHSSSRHRSSSSSYRQHRRSNEHEYERPRNDRKSSRDRDDKYERYSRKRHHREDNYRSSRHTPTESSQTINDQIEASEIIQPTSTSSPSTDRSRHSHHKKSSKRSRHDSDDERNTDRHRHRSKDHSSTSNSKKSTNQSDSLSDIKEQLTE